MEAMGEGIVASFQVRKEDLDRIGKLADKTDEIRAAIAFVWDAPSKSEVKFARSEVNFARAALREMRRELREIYTRATGDDPWDFDPSTEAATEEALGKE